MIFDGIDLDDILQRYNRSQKFNLTDVSAFMIAGPFGAVVTKGSDFTSLISADLKPEQKTFISKFFIISQKAAKIKKNVKISVKILFEHYIKKTPIVNKKIKYRYYFIAYL